MGRWQSDMHTTHINASFSLSPTHPRCGNIYWATTDNDESQFGLFILSVTGFVSPQGHATSISCPLCPFSLYCDLSHSKPYEWTILALTTASRTRSSAAGAVCCYACLTLRAHNEMKRIFWILWGHTDVEALSVLASLHILDIKSSLTVRVFSTSQRLKLLKKYC